MELREVTYLAVALRIIAAILLGGLMGLERGLKNRPAGMRTYMMVCMGSCLIMLTNQYIFQIYGAGDPVRMGAQVVSGIGFLGAGTIIVTRRTQIKGLTTAAGLWTAAGVGLALGIGFYEAALAGAIGSIVAMTVMQRMDLRLHRKGTSLDVYIELPKDTTLGDFMRKAQEVDIDVTNIERDSISVSDSGIHSYILTVQGKKRRLLKDYLEMIRAIDCVTYVEEL